jgi:uncharacterized protein with NAD-binding domain and iron-sulfur cluster
MPKVSPEGSQPAAGERPGRVRVAMVGGGPASLAAAFRLTQEEPGKYDITIYEMGHRLGGKTASGRGEGGRIEEHGLHILFGCYHNVFRMLRSCYDELRTKQLVSPEVHSLQYFSDAITPHHYGVIGDDNVEPWRRIDIQFPTNRGVPGDPPLPTLWDLVITVFQIAWHVVFGARSLALLQRLAGPLFDYRNRWKRTDFEKPAWEEAHPLRHREANVGRSFFVRVLLKLSLWLLDRKTAGGFLMLRALYFGHWLWRGVERLFIGPTARVWASLDFMFAMFRGMSEDRVLAQPGGFEAIDGEDFREWLARHRAARQTLASPWMRIIYDAAFSYPKGGNPPADGRLPPGLRKDQLFELIAAGAALRVLLVMVITFKGAFYNKMDAGMGDVIHTPLYLVLKSRGVRFEYFHRLVDARAGDSAGRPVVDELEFDTLPDRVNYDPLVPVEGLLCWPSAPKLDEIPETSHARALRAESYATADLASARVRLRRGEDFDLVVFGFPGACLPYAAPSLLAQVEARTDLPEAKLTNQWRIDSVHTIALQLWLKPTLAELGWPRPSPLTSLFIDPLNTWCDMTHLLRRERWHGVRPGNLAYFCGALPHAVEFPSATELTPALASEVDRRLLAQARDVSLEFVNRYLRQLLPVADGGEGFNYNLLVDAENRSGEARFSAAYFRVNYEPHARCTLALPNTTQYRMRAEATGYDNLFVAGDWTDNSIYLAAVEAAVQSGLHAARSIARATGGPVMAYSIVAEELLNVRVLSSEPKRGAA